MTSRTEARLLVTAVTAVVSLGSVGVFYLGGDHAGGFPAAVAVCALSLMGIAASYLILVRR